MYLLRAIDKQGVALTGRNSLYWPAVECYRGAIIRLEAAWRHRLAYAGEAASSLYLHKCYIRRQTTTTDARVHH